MTILLNRGANSIYNSKCGKKKHEVPVTLKINGNEHVRGPRRMFMYVLFYYCLFVYLCMRMSTSKRMYNEIINIQVHRSEVHCGSAVRFGQALPGFIITAHHLYAAVIGLLAVWRHNKPKPKPKTELNWSVIRSELPCYGPFCGRWDSECSYVCVVYWTEVNLKILKTTFINRTRLRTKGQSAGYPQAQIEINSNSFQRQV